MQAFHSSTNTNIQSVTRPGTEGEDWARIKYDHTVCHGLQCLLDADSALDLPPSYSAALTSEAYSQQIHASLARATWDKVFPGLSASTIGGRLQSGVY